MSAPVPATAVSICNRALSRLGISYTIQALTDASKEAYQCNLWYVPCREAALQDIPWGFATARITLALAGTGVATPPWTYKYAYPADCLMARSIDVGAIVTDPKQRIPFAIESDGTESGRVILCDFPNAVLTYTLAISNPALFPPLFADALAYRLAEELAMPMSVSPQIRDSVHLHYELALSRAIMADHREQQDRQEPDASFIQARR